MRRSPGINARLTEDSRKRPTGWAGSIHRDPSSERILRRPSIGTQKQHEQTTSRRWLRLAITSPGELESKRTFQLRFVYGLMLRDGRGVAIDRIAAYVWICRAIDNDLPEENRNIAITVRQALLKSMPPDDKIRAQASIDASGNEPPEHARDGDTRRTPPAASAA
jgi:TPR repeat protein